MDAVATKRTKQSWIGIADRIASDIRSGVLAPGLWLKQIDLERRYDCRRAEVRRALDRLAQRRIIEHVPNRGYQVFLPDGNQATQILEVRVILETGAADAIVANASAEDIAALHTLAQRFGELVKTGTILELYEANLAFHSALLGLCGNPELAGLVSELRHRTSSAPAGQWRTQARVETSCAEHHQIVDSIAARDSGRLRELIALHIRQPVPA
ncbi:DNA-binding transcriptional regulator, GntR family [Rhizobiales bacterium GAS191]|nr:DNA-binding transcriptional regulator, GntR family [Rhizobiales bacterium GAS191]